MGIRNRKRETLKRLDSKTLDAQFLQEIQHGLNCSLFEAEAVLEVVKEVYFPFLDQQSVKAPPGKVTLIARRPPHRSVRAGLPHTTPASGIWRRNAHLAKGAVSWAGEAKSRRAFRNAPTSCGVAGCDDVTHAANHEPLRRETFPEHRDFRVLRGS